MHHINLVVKWVVYTDLFVAQGSDLVGHHSIGMIDDAVCSGGTGTRQNIFSNLCRVSGIQNDDRTDQTKTIRKEKIKNMQMEPSY